MPLTKEEISKIRQEAEALYPNQRSNGNDIYHANDMADAKQEAHTAAVTAERERTKGLVEAAHIKLFEKHCHVDDTIDAYVHYKDAVEIINSFNQ